MEEPNHISVSITPISDYTLYCDGGEPEILKMLQRAIVIWEDLTLAEQTIWYFYHGEKPWISKTKPVVVACSCN